MSKLLNWRRAIIGAGAWAVASTCGAPVRAAEIVPGLAAGWPVVLRGTVIGSPVAADLDGDGKLEVVASAMMRKGDPPLASPAPTIAVQLWAFGVEGRSFEGWPLTVKTAEARQAMYDDKGFAPWADNWYASPTVYDINGDGASEIILNTAGHGTNEAHGNILALYGDGGRVSMGFGSSDWATVPLSDIDLNGTPDIVLDNVLTSVDGKPVRTWPYDKRPRSDYQSTTGDVDGDGQPEVFLPSMKDDVWGFRNNGEPLPGWPRKVRGNSTYIVLGDVAGDSNKEIISVDWTNRLHIWNLDGTPTVPTVEGGALEGDAVVATNLSGFSPPCLADLDGDGKAEILTLGDSALGVYAFRGDGRPFLPSARAEGEAWPTLFTRGADGKDRQLDPNVPADLAILEEHDARGRRGRIARLPHLNATDTGGVTAVDLGGDGVMDIFVGTQWIRLAKDGTTQMTDMVPPEMKPERFTAPLSVGVDVEGLPAGTSVTVEGIERTAEGALVLRVKPAGSRPARAVISPRASNAGSCSVVDIDGDGLAEVIFGLSDGHLFVYRTGMKLEARHAQWPTLSGNFQHTGVWTAARKQE